MKNILALIGLFIAATCFAQQPPYPSCITNVVVIITDTNCTPTGSTNGSPGLTIHLSSTNCPVHDTTIGWVTAQCDINRTCQVDQGGTHAPCAPSATFPIVLEGACFSYDIQFNSGGCCSISQTKSNRQWCDVPPGCP
jgi:hypothetical protein